MCAFWVGVCVCVSKTDSIFSVTEEKDARDVRHGIRRKVEETQASRSSSKETLVGDHEDGQASARRRLSELEGIERLV